jgi:hypothetical protein
MSPPAKPATTIKRHNISKNMEQKDRSGIEYPCLDHERTCDTSMGIGEAASLKSNSKLQTAANL